MSSIDVLPALRDMHSMDLSILETHELYLQGMLFDKGYLNYWPSLVEIGVALEVLALERDVEEEAA